MAKQQHIVATNNYQTTYHQLYFKIMRVCFVSRFCTIWKVSSCCFQVVTGIIWVVF